MQVIRPYMSTDLAAMVTLDAVCFAPEFLFTRSAMRRYAESRHAKTFVAEADDGGLMGFVIVNIERRTAGLRGYVVTLDVAPSCRRRGIAGQLLQSIEDYAVTAEAQWMELHVWVQNDTAIRFYESRAYRRIGLDEGFYGSGMDSYVYRKVLQTTHSE